MIVLLVGVCWTAASVVAGIALGATLRGVGGGEDRIAAELARPGRQATSRRSAEADPARR